MKVYKYESSKSSRGSPNDGRVKVRTVHNIGHTSSEVVGSSAYEERKTSGRIIRTTRVKHSNYISSISNHKVISFFLFYQPSANIKKYNIFRAFGYKFPKYNFRSNLDKICIQGVVKNVNNYRSVWDGI